ncbi:hypothetical protein BN1708_010738 [Verticillium longisporum]|uniref:Nucleoporin Nup133/Nup155-like C-terminal domain-containing protein n=1 Tax=Verticillium longisporum TaxID=100787 RepID=A0A0G4KV77_VERLO|nr:hypothetical protein BN1708_010738 [Verticillium longisporum]
MALHADFFADEISPDAAGPDADPPPDLLLLVEVLDAVPPAHRLEALPRQEILQLGLALKRPRADVTHARQPARKGDNVVALTPGHSTLAGQQAAHGLSREQQVWNKKIELSLGKLALMAEAEQPSESSPGLFGSRRVNKLTVAKDEAKQEEQLDEIDNELAIIQIQDDLYKQIYPSASVAVDDSAALDLAMESHATNIPRKQKALNQVFENGMRRLLNHEALDAMTLIDMLTLVALKPETASEMQDPFYLALQVADHGLKSEELKMAKRLIWRRCYIRDDWMKLNDTQLKDDAQVQEALGETALFGALITGYHHQTLETPFHYVRPSEALGAFVDGPDRRFHDMDKPFREKLVQNSKEEDTLLRKYIDKARLEKWARSTAETAETEVAAYADEQTRAGAEQTDGDAESLDETPSSLRLNGSTNGIH